MIFEITDEYLASFKSKMHITTKNEDAILRDLLAKSAEAVAELTGDDDLVENGFDELVKERARYAYNDQLEYFNDNFQSLLLDRSLKNYAGDADDENTV